MSRLSSVTDARVFSYDAGPQVPPPQVNPQRHTSAPAVTETSKAFRVVTRGPLQNVGVPEEHQLFSLLPFIGDLSPTSVPPPLGAALHRHIRTFALFIVFSPLFYF